MTGLTDTYESVRTHILTLDPLPSVLLAYQMAVVAHLSAMIRVMMLLQLDVEVEIIGRQTEEGQILPKKIGRILALGKMMD